MAQEDSSTIAVKSIRLGVILVAALLIGGYFFWSAMTWDERFTFTWNVLSLVTLAAFVFGILASAIQYTLGQDSPFIASLFKFPTEWLKYKAALFEAKRNDMLTQEQLIQVNEKAKQDVLDFIQVSRDTLELIKSEIPAIVESKYQDFLHEFENVAKDTLEQYKVSEKRVEGSTTRARLAIFALMRKIIFDWLKVNVHFADIETEEDIPKFCNANALLEVLRSHDKVFFENEFSIPVIEKFCEKKETREYLWNEIINKRKVENE